MAEKLPRRSRALARVGAEARAFLKRKAARADRAAAHIDPEGAPVRRAYTTTPVWCEAILAGPPPETIDRARQILDCERLTAAEVEERCAAGLRHARAALLAVPEPPSRVL